MQQLERWEVSQLSVSSRHNAVVMRICADEKLGLCDPSNMFSECLDPPDAATLEDAIEYLAHIGACS